MTASSLICMVNSKHLVICFDSYNGFLTNLLLIYLRDGGVIIWLFCYIENNTFYITQCMKYLKLSINVTQMFIILY